MPESTLKAAPNVASWNVYYLNSVANILGGLQDLIAHGADVIGVQELSVDATLLSVRDEMAKLGWECTKQNAAVPIFWDAKTWDCVTEAYEVVEPGGGRWEPGTGGSIVIRKALTWVLLRNRKTGDEHYALNNHIVPGIVRNGELDKKVPIRLKVTEHQLNYLATKVRLFRETGHSVSVTGDFNIAHDEPAGAWLRARMHKAGLRSNWETLPHDEDTHGLRIIDYTWFAGCWAHGDKVLAKHGSDHSPEVTDLQGYLPAYVVDAAKFDPKNKGPFLYAVNAKGEHTAERKPGFRITTGVAFINVQNRRYLVTEAGNRYATEYLSLAKEA